MADRDIEIGRLEATTESLRNQSANQFERIDKLETQVAKLESGIEALKERVETSGGAPAEASRRLPDFVYSWRVWVAVVGLLGCLLGAWSIQDVRSLLFPVP